MTDYTTLSNTAVGVGGLPSGATVTALRDNPIAIAEGTAGAPRVLHAALDATVTTDGTNWVLGRTAGATAGAVGTYAFMERTGNNASIDIGGTIAGSSIRYAGVDKTNTQQMDISSSATTPSGTWQCMGYIAFLGDTSSERASLFLRIS